MRAMRPRRNLRNVIMMCVRTEGSLCCRRHCGRRPLWGLHGKGTNLFPFVSSLLPNYHHLSAIFNTSLRRFATRVCHFPTFVPSFCFCTWRPVGVRFGLRDAAEGPASPPVPLFVSRLATAVYADMPAGREGGGGVILLFSPCDNLC